MHTDSSMPVFSFKFHYLLLSDSVFYQVAQVMKFLSVLSFDRRCVDEISELGMISIISQGIEARKDDEDFVLDALTVLSNAVPNPQVYSKHSCPCLHFSVSFCDEQQNLTTSLWAWFCNPCTMCDVW